MKHLKAIALAVQARARQHPLISGVAAATAFSMVLNTNAVAAAISIPLLLSTLPCLLMMVFCMKGVKGTKGCDSKSPAEAAQKDVVIAGAARKTDKAKLNA